MPKVSLFLLFLFVLTIFFVWVKLNQEPPPLSQQQKKEALENILGRDIREEKSIPQGEKFYQGKYFSLSYPAYAESYDRGNGVFRLDSEEPKFRFVAMVDTQDTAALDELSAVRTRRVNKQYKQTPITVDGNSGVLFVKLTDGIERASFFIKDGRSYSFVITGVDTSVLEEVYGKIMDSLKF